MTMPSPDQDRLTQALLIVAGISLPRVFGLVWNQTPDSWQDSAFMAASSGVLALTGMLAGITTPVAIKVKEGAAHALLTAMQNWRDRRYRKPYLEYLVLRHRTLDVKSLNVVGPLCLNLEQIFVELRIASLPIRSSNAVIPEYLSKGAHSIWEFLNEEDCKLLIIGEPGSGKTTLLKFITVTLAGRNRKSPRHILNKLPALLFLRDHAQTIAYDPTVRLATLIRNSLTMMEEKPPAGWFEKHLKQGHCVIMLDGLNEIGDPSLRAKVVKWIEEQIPVYGKNCFIVTSRPYGYHTSPLSSMALLEICPFSREQITRFIHNWFLVNAFMSHEQQDRGVEIEAERDTHDLLKRIYDVPDIAELAVNPLLLTMLANVRRFRSSLPRRRVELYEAMCDIFLGKRGLAKTILTEMPPAQMQSVLQLLAYTMMVQGKREISIEEALQIIADPLKPIPLEGGGRAFLQILRDHSGILLERENGTYSFAHQTFQEFLTTAHTQREKLSLELVKLINDEWWHEAIRLYCARADATPIITACLKAEPQPISVLILAIACLEEALQVQADVCQHLERVLERDVESDDPERSRIAASAQLSLRLRRMPRHDDDTYIDNAPITCAEYQLFVDDNNAIYAPDHWAEPHFPVGQALSPVTGVPQEGVKAFCEWLNARENQTMWKYRAPTKHEITEPGPFWFLDDTVLRIIETAAVTMPFRYWIVSQDPPVGDEQLAAIDITAPPLNYLRKVNLHDMLVLALDGARFRVLARANNRADNLGLTLARAHTRNLAHDRDLARVLVLTVTRARSLARDLGRDRADYLDLALALASDLALALDLDLDITHDLDLDRTLDFALDLDLERTIDVALDLALDLDRTSARALTLDLNIVRAVELNRALARARTLARASRFRAVADNMADLLDLFCEVSKLIVGYLVLAGNKSMQNSHTTLLGLKQAGLLDDFRVWTLHRIYTYYKEQPSHGLSRPALDSWKQTLDELMLIYAALATLARRQSGAWDSFEMVRLVKARRKDEA